MGRHNNFQRKVEVLGFVDGDISLNWINDAGGKVINLLCKGSLRHLEKQLKKTPEIHIHDVKNILRKAEMRDMEVNIYLEDWSNGMIHSEEYVFYLLDSLKDENIQRFMLPDTLGILNPEQTFNFCKKNYLTGILLFTLIFMLIMIMILQSPTSFLQLKQE